MDGVPWMHSWNGQPSLRHSNFDLAHNGWPQTRATLRHTAVDENRDCERVNYLVLCDPETHVLKLPDFNAVSATEEEADAHKSWVASC